MKRITKINFGLWTLIFGLTLLLGCATAKPQKVYEIPITPQSTLFTW
jgi:hypothetical protein